MLAEAVKILGTYTAGRYDIWALAGNAKASCRAHVMSVLLGRKCVQRESGINALRSEFYRQMQIGGPGTCEAERETTFRNLCRSNYA